MVVDLSVRGSNPRSRGLRRFLTLIGSMATIEAVVNRTVKAVLGVGVTGIGDIRVERGGGDLWIVSLSGEHDLQQRRRP